MSELFLGLLLTDTERSLERLLTTLQDGSRRRAFLIQLRMSAVPRLSKRPTEPLPLLDEQPRLLPRILWLSGDQSCPPCFLHSIPDLGLAAVHGSHLAGSRAALLALGACVCGCDVDEAGPGPPTVSAGSYLYLPSPGRPCGMAPSFPAMLWVSLRLPLQNQPHKDMGLLSGAVGLGWSIRGLPAASGPLHVLILWLWLCDLLTMNQSSDLSSGVSCSGKPG